MTETNNQATDGGKNPHYSPRADAVDAVAEHLMEDDSAYEDRQIAEEQAERILKAIERRGLKITEVEANAHLLAAAWDMQSALFEAEKDLTLLLEDKQCDHAVNICWCGYRQNLEDIRAALAKARGEG